MTIRRNPNRGNQQAREAFVGQASEEDKKRLHCFIPAGIHRAMKQMALDEDTDMTVLVIEALENYINERQGSAG